MGRRFLVRVGDVLRLGCHCWAAGGGDKLILLLKITEGNRPPGRRTLARSHVRPALPHAPKQPFPSARRSHTRKKNRSLLLPAFPTRARTQSARWFLTSVSTLSSSCLHSISALAGAHASSPSAPRSCAVVNRHHRHQPGRCRRCPHPLGTCTVFAVAGAAFGRDACDIGRPYQLAAAAARRAGCERSGALCRAAPPSARVAPPLPPVRRRRPWCPMSARSTARYSTP